MVGLPSPGNRCQRDKLPEKTTEKTPKVSRMTRYAKPEFGNKPPSALVLSFSPTVIIEFFSYRSGCTCY